MMCFFVPIHLPKWQQRRDATRSKVQTADAVVLHIRRIGRRCDDDREEEDDADGPSGGAMVVMVL
jgi:hypothetical protein